MTKDEALKLALEALNATESDCGGRAFEREQEAITAIKEVLAQPQPWEKFCDSNCVWTDHHPDCKLAEQHQDWCASLTQMLMSMPPKPAPCNCKPKPLPWTNKMSIDVPNQPLYTAPQRTWVGLTDEEIKALASWWPSYDQMPALMVLAKDIQNSLKEKNT